MWKPTVSINNDAAAVALGMAAVALLHLLPLLLM